MRLIDDSATDFDRLRRTFKWKIPHALNIADQVCDRHTAHFDRPALYCENQAGDTAMYTFGQIKTLSNRLANALKALGIKPQDRVAIVLSQRVETALAHLACYKLGAIALPLSILFGPDALSYRLQDSGAAVVITDRTQRDVIQELQAGLPDLKHVIGVRSGPEASEFWHLLEKASDQVPIARTRADDPALLIYTSGTTGPPKGALVAQRAILGNLTGFELSHDFFPQPDDLFWTPADWAWTGGLWDALLPAWYYARPVLAYEGGKFDPEKACHLMAKYAVRNAFIPPTALKMMRPVSGIREKYGVRLRSVMSAGESVGEELIHWGREALGLTINEMWGQTEFNYLVGNCAAIMEVRPGSMGKPYPGHMVDVIDPEGHVLPAGETGELAARTNDPVMFLGYWNKPDATRHKIKNEWFCTGDMGVRDGDGYLWFVGRTDDVISSAGYRLGPGEIENCLLKHPAVLQAAVIGKPDKLRGAIVKAFIVLAPGHAPDQSLKEEIQSSVRQRLAAFEYPREIEFIDALPMTTTGKVRRVELRGREASES
jgi:acetyl-CoA synthetase